MSRPDQYYEDGFRGGNELPDDLDLDRMIYPERKAKPEPMEWPEGMTYDEYQAMKDRKEDEQAAANYRADRVFDITVGDVTGQKPGPPRRIP